MRVAPGVEVLLKNALRAFTSAMVAWDEKVGEEAKVGAPISATRLGHGLQVTSHLASSMGRPEATVRLLPDGVRCRGRQPRAPVVGQPGTQ
jgi:hypothetical protein